MSYGSAPYTRTVDGVEYEWREGPRGLGWYNDEHHWFLSNDELEVRAGGRAVASTVSDERTWAMLAHVLALFTWIIGPLVIYLTKGNESPMVKANAAEALNFEITVTIGYVVSVVLMLVLVGLFTFVAIAIAALVLPIIGAVRANQGDVYRYPFTIRFVS